MKKSTSAETNKWADCATRGICMCSSEGQTYHQQAKNTPIFMARKFTLSRLNARCSFIRSADWHLERVTCPLLCRSAVYASCCTVKWHKKSSYNKCRGGAFVTLGKRTGKNCLRFKHDAYTGFSLIL